MKQLIRRLGAVVALAGVIAAAFTAVVSAQQPPPGPSDKSVGVEGRITSPPPNQAASIVSPANGQNFSAIPITVTGSCLNDTLVKIFSNNVFVGSAQCNGGSYSLQISLFAGRNDLVAKIFDALDQAGPDSPTVSITFTDPQFAQFGNQVLLTSQYARRAADVGTILRWPIILSGGTGPYALSIDWGDGTPAELKSLAFAGVIELSHNYREAGIYRVIFKVSDANGSASFLQAIAVVNGSGGTNRTIDNSGEGETIIQNNRVLWQPAAALLLLLPVSFWIGKRYQLSVLRKQLEREYRG